MTDTETHWVTSYSPIDGEPIGEVCSCDLGYHHLTDGRPDPHAPAGEIPHQPDPIEVVSGDGGWPPASARCGTCKGGRLEWRGDRWSHADAPYLDPAATKE